MRDPVVWQEPDLIVRNGHRFEIRRQGERGRALRGAGRRAPGAAPRYACTIYDNRPKPCREFAAGGRHCLDARRRVGLSAGAGRTFVERVDRRWPRRSICSFRSRDLDAAARPAGRARARLGARERRASCASCAARSTRAKGGRSASGCASRSPAAGRRWRRRRRRAPPSRWPAGRPPPRVVVIGSGPAGTWAALRLAEAGVPATILEQGKPVQPRRRDLALITRGELAPRSNYCFGEGGAGTYSDGKLYTRAKDRAGVAEVIADLVRFGAPAEIEAESRPHVGSNRLPQVLGSAARAPGRARRRVSLRDRGHRARRRGGARPRGARRRRRDPGRRRRAGGGALGARRLRLGGGRRGSPSRASRSRSACASSTRSRSSIGSSTAPPRAIPSCRPRSTS